MSADVNLEGLFQRRERRVGKPLRPPVRAGTLPDISSEPSDPETSARNEAPAPVAAPPAPPPRTAPNPSPRPRTRPRKPNPANDPEPVERYSIFLTLDQAQWLKALRGRLLVAGWDVSASQVVRLALERLREANLTDEELRHIADEEQVHVRGRGRPRSGAA